MRRGLVSLCAGVFGALLSTSCGNDVNCAPGTMLVGSSCEPIDAGVPDSGAGGNCGPNTMLVNGTCQLINSACGPGTQFDPATSTCQIPTNYGTMVWQSTLTNTWDTMAGPPVNTDAGVTFNPVGNPASLPAGIDMTTPMFMFNGDPMGQLTHIPVTWFSGNESYTWTAIDHQITVGEWAKCHGSWELYKNPPSGKKNYVVVVRLQGCPPDTQFSVWHFFSTDGTLDNRYLGAPLGGVPNAFNIGPDGSGLFVREIDPNVWLKMDTPLPGAFHGPSGVTPKIPNTTQFPQATYYVDVAYHNGGQSNGNFGVPGFCGPVDNAGNCPKQPFPDLLLPGTLGVDWGALLTGATFPAAEDPNAPTTTKPIPIGMVQPY